MIHLPGDLRSTAVDTATIAQGLRATAALVELAGQTITAVVADSIEHLADRVHPPGLDGYTGFDAQAKLDEAPGYRMEWRQDEAGCWVVKQ